MSNELNKCYICDKEFDQLEIHFLKVHAFEEGLVEDANEKENIVGKNTIEDNNKIVHEGENKSHNFKKHRCDIW